MLHVVLYQPEIPPNTGNIMRLCANAGAALHLIEPLGFTLEEKQLRRAGLDYRDLAPVRIWPCLEDCLNAAAVQRWFAISTRGGRRYSEVQFTAGDALIFGPESRGLPQDLLDRCPPDRRLRIPMLPNNRSLNLSNAVAVVVYEAWRQQDFGGGA